MSWVLKLWLGTLDFRIVFDPRVHPLTCGRPMLYAFWHETLLLPAYAYARLGIAVMVSRHRDGELIAQVVRMLRGRTVRGSTTRGAVVALREMLRLANARHLAITPDGPRGPRREFQAGGIYLASKAGMPIVPCGFAAGACWRAPSWDKMILPRPFRAARVVAGAPIEVPPELDRDGVEHYRQLAQAELRRVQQHAEHLADANIITPDMITAEQSLRPS